VREVEDGELEPLRTSLEMSGRQVFSTAPQLLESIRTELPAYMSCFPEQSVPR
jgi:hypothetical protein